VAALGLVAQYTVTFVGVDPDVPALNLTAISDARVALHQTGWLA